MAPANIHNTQDGHPECVSLCVRAQPSVKSDLISEKSRGHTKARLGSEEQPCDLMKTEFSSRDNHWHIFSFSPLAPSHTIKPQLGSRWTERQACQDTSSAVAAVKQNDERNGLNQICREMQRSVSPLKDRKILGADRSSLDGGSAPDDKASRARSQDSLSHNIVPLFVDKREEESAERHATIRQSTKELQPEDRVYGDIFG